MAAPSGGRRLVRAVAACAVLAVSCGTSDRAPAPAQKNGSTQLRHDLEPLTTRFPSLGAPLGATWLSGTISDSRAPGPSTYWIDAVVQLAPAQAAALRANFALHDSGKRPDLLPELRGTVPAGPLLTSDDLDRARTSGNWGVTVYVDEGSPTVVITAIGG